MADDIVFARVDGAADQARLVLERDTCPDEGDEWLFLEAVDIDGKSVNVPLTRTGVAALVGQLTAWLQRTAPAPQGH